MSATGFPASVTAFTSSADCKLEYRIVGDLRGLFYIPDYQRGYRWVAEDVTRLLDDLWESAGRPYSLQPVVVRQRPATTDAENAWELVDGQQRLTTLFLLLQYMHHELYCGLGAPYRLQYQTREESEAYLQKVVAAGHEDDIDLYHLYQAHVAIGGWFGRRGDKFEQNAMANRLHGYLFESVHVPARVRETLVERRGPYAAYLGAIEALERGPGISLERAVHACSISLEQCNHAVLRALSAPDLIAA